MGYSLSPASMTVLVLLSLTTTYVHFRGKVRHKFLRQLTDHSTFTSPINCLMYLFSAVPNTPYIDVARFPELKVLEDNWQLIREEALELTSQEAIRASRKLDDVGFNSFFRQGWKRFYLKWYGSSIASAKVLCPGTAALLDSIPTVKAGMFAMLPPGGRLVRHRDPYAGSLRYHLGLVTPNSEDCYISVDGQHYYWRDGEAVIFDETYIHHAENKSDVDRIILFLDIKRPSEFFIIDWLNSLFGRVVLAAGATKNMDGDKVGAVNRIFFAIYQVRIVGKKLKTYNRKLYYLAKYLLIGSLFYLIFF